MSIFYLKKLFFLKTPDGLVLAADFHNNDVYELEGEVEALKLVDLDREGLAEYRSQLKKFENGYETSITSIIDQSNEIKIYLKKI